MSNIKGQKFYVNPKELREEIAICFQKNELTSKAVLMFQKMANEASKKLRYKNEEDRKDCIGYALMDVCKYWRSYDSEKSNNAFAYFTQMIKNGFAKGWKKLHPINGFDMVSLDNENIFNM